MRSIRIQAMTRKSGSIVHNVTIPKSIIEESGFSKHDEVDVSCDKNKNIIIKRI